ncbi:membrane protein [Bacteroidia bacterium]|nr:membrane protein [Bacteroidia bacterium]
MKKIVLSSLMFAGCLLSGCSGFLDETPKSAIPEEDAYKSSTLVYVNSVASIYSSFGGRYYGSRENVHCLQEFVSDAWILPGRQANWVDGGKWQTIFLHSYGPGLATVNTVWNDLYNIIGRCNTSIDNLEKFIQAGGDDFLKDYQYEVRGIRAIVYYSLLDFFGRIPIVTSSQTKMADVNQSSRSEVYKFIVDELTECIPHLASAKSQNAGTYYGRITKAVGYMALAKMAINAPIFTKDNWADGTLVGGIDKVAPVVNEAGKNINITLDGATRNAWETVIYCQQQIEKEGYSLSPDFKTNFAKNNDTSVENIWAQPSDGTTYKITDQQLTQTMHPSHASAYKLQGWNGACATLEQMKVFKYGTDEQDPRMDLTFFYGNIVVNGTQITVTDNKPLIYNPTSVVVDFEAGVEDYTVKMAGARMGKYEIDNTTPSDQNHNNDKVYYRYADALLLSAEAKVRLGQSGDEEVNKVRARVGATLKTNVTLHDLLDERLLELSYEGMRRQDQVRFGTYTEPTLDKYVGVHHNVVVGDYVDDKTGYTTVYPIPTNVMQLNTKLTQNPGYN